MNTEVDMIMNTNRNKNSNSNSNICLTKCTNHRPLIEEHWQYSKMSQQLSCDLIRNILSSSNSSSQAQQMWLTICRLPATTIRSSMMAHFGHLSFLFLSSSILHFSFLSSSMFREDERRACMQRRGRRTGWLTNICLFLLTFWT